MERKIIGVKELSKYLGVAEGTIYRWKREKKVGHLKINGRLKFDLGAIEEWLGKKEFKAA